MGSIGDFHPGKCWACVRNGPSVLCLFCWLWSLGLSHGPVRLAWNLVLPLASSSPSLRLDATSSFSLPLRSLLTLHSPPFPSSGTDAQIAVMQQRIDRLALLNEKQAASPSEPRELEELRGKNERYNSACFLPSSIPHSVPMGWQ